MTPVHARVTMLMLNHTCFVTDALVAAEEKKKWKYQTASY